MSRIRKPPTKFDIRDLDRELIARGANIAPHSRFKFTDKEGTPQRDEVMRHVQAVYDDAADIPRNNALRHLSTWDLVKIIIYKTRVITPTGVRGVYGEDERLDIYELKGKEEEQTLIQNADSVVAVCMACGLMDAGNGISVLKTKRFGKVFSLNEFEPFDQQPVAAGKLCTGFLVHRDVIATAAHFASEDNVTALRFVFGYRMLDPYTAVTQVPHSKIYRGIKIIDRVYDPKGTGSDWALVKLDRDVEGQHVVELAISEAIGEKGIYVMGHPCGLPLKFGPGKVVNDSPKAYFSAGLDIYSGNSGSPVFDAGTHKVAGMVVRGDKRDFRWTGRGLLSINYPAADKDYRGSDCTRAIEFEKVIRKL